MIRRELLNGRFGPDFDFFNDANDTIEWLRKVSAGAEHDNPPFARRTAERADQLQHALDACIKNHSKPTRKINGEKPCPPEQ